MVRTPRTAISRRAFLGGTVAVVAAGCATTDATTSTASTTSTTSTTRPGQGLPLTLVALFDAPGGIVVSGITQRLTWAIGDGSGVLSAEQPERLEFEFELDGRRVGTVEGIRRDVGLEQAFIASNVIFPAPGLATATATIQGTAVSAEIEVVAPDSSDVPGPGDPMRPVDTPTTRNPMGATPLCSRVPACPFHELSLTAALDASEPVVLLVATPGYCESTLCPPALDLLVDAAPRWPEVTFVHAEVYVDPESVDRLLLADRTDAVHAYGLAFEPSLFLASSTGLVVDRLDNVFDADELTEALEALS